MSSPARSRLGAENITEAAMSLCAMISTFASPSVLALDTTSATSPLLPSAADPTSARAAAMPAVISPWKADTNTLLAAILSQASDDFLKSIGITRIAQPAPQHQQLPLSASGAVFGDALGCAPPVPPPTPPAAALSPLLSVSPLSPLSPASRAPEVGPKIDDASVRALQETVRNAVDRTTWPDDNNAFKYVNGVKWRPQLRACVATLQCCSIGCPARRKLTVSIANPSSFLWETLPHSDHAVSPPKKPRTDPRVKQKAIVAASCGAKPALIARTLAQDAAAENALLRNGAPVDETQTMSAKQIQNLKHRTVTAQMPPARSFEELMLTYKLEIFGASCLPCRIPMIAVWAKDLLGCAEFQFYIDSTFDMVEQGWYLTPLLVSLPINVGSTTTLGPVVPVAFYVHSNKAAPDYEFFLMRFKEATGGRLRAAYWHRDYDEAIENAITRVRRPIPFD